MSVINTDISRMKKDANELRLLAMKYNKKINDFKILMANMDCWSGVDADNYVKTTMENCTVYEEIGRVLQDYALYLNKEADNLDKFSKINSLNG